VTRSRPTLGAGPERVIVPVDEAPAAITVGEIASLAVGAAMRIEPAADPPSAENVSVPVVSLPTGELVRLTFAEVAPAGTFTLVGPAICEMLEWRPTVRPPAGAGPFKVTVAENALLPNTELDDIVTEVGWGPPCAAPMVASRSIPAASANLRWRVLIEPVRRSVVRRVVSITQLL